MDPRRFDAFAKTLAVPQSRRATLRAAIGAIGALVAARSGAALAAPPSCRHASDCASLIGSVCSSGHCLCPGGQRVCGSSCVDSSSDPKHCGQCDNVCNPGEICRSHACHCPDDHPTSCRDQETGQMVCIDTQSHNANCGHCGVECDLCPDGAGALHSRSCVAGQCAPPEGFTQCGEQCVDLKTDHRNCGACNNGCFIQEACSNGQCVPCPPGGVFCKGSTTCTDLRTDPRNCGECGRACVSGATCVGGACQACSAGLTECRESHGEFACINLQNDVDNCGACNNTCELSSENCVGGACVCKDPTLTQCADGCFDLMTSNAACGACGHVCGACDLNGGQLALVCDHGQCAGAQGLLACNGICVDPLKDRDNCGACGLRCATLPPAEECDNGECVACQLGWAICPGSDKCVDLRSDPQRCGHCGTVCPDGVPCFNGQCGCPDGEHACGADCCPNGRLCCNHVCCDAQTTSCGADGSCQAACPNGQKRCPSGGCAACCTSNDCPGGSCQGGVCQFTGWSCAGLSKFDWCDHGQKGNCICVPEIGGSGGLQCVAAADGCIPSSPGVCAPCAGCADGTFTFCVLGSGQTEVCVNLCHN